MTPRQTEQALTAAEDLVSGLNQTAASLTAAGEAWEATFQTLGLDAGKPGEGPASESGEPRRPFDVRDYHDTAEELRRVAIELRGLVRDVQALTGATGEDTPLGNLELAAQSAAAAAAGEGRNLVDYIAWRLIQLVGVIFLAAIIYRVTASRIAPRPSP